MLVTISARAESIQRKSMGLILIVTVPTQKKIRDAEPMGFFSKITSLLGHKPNPSFEVATGIVERLIELDFLKFVPASDQTNVRAQLVKSIQYNYLDSEWDDDCVSFDKRSYSADAGNRAAGDVGKCLLQMKAVLIQEGVALEVIEDDTLA